MSYKDYLNLLKKVTRNTEPDAFLLDTVIDGMESERKTEQIILGIFFAIALVIVGWGLRGVLG